MKSMKITKQITRRETESVSIYLQEISKLNKTENLTLDQEIELAERIKKGDKRAETELIHRNLRFVISVAKHYQHEGCSFEDLISEGNYGLVKAAKKYDSTKGCKFISYAVWWIRQTILCFINDNSRTIRLPLNKTGQLIKIKKVQNQLEQKLQRKPSTEETLDALDFEISKDSYNNIFSINNGVQSINVEMSSRGSSFSEGFTLEEMLENDTFSSAEDQIESQDLKRIINLMLNEMSDKHRQVLEFYYGLNGKAVKNTDEISQCLDLTKERIRQINKMALRIISNKRNKKILEPYIK